MKGAARSTELKYQILKSQFTSKWKQTLRSTISYIGLFWSYIYPAIELSEKQLHISYAYLLDL